MGGRKGIQPVKMNAEVLPWLSAWSKMQMICIWSSWCHCHPLISCSSKIQNGLPFWNRLTQVVLKKRPLNGCSSTSYKYGARKIYPKTCHKIILWQKLSCHKTILRHILSKFAKYVLGYRKIWRITIESMTFAYNFVYVTGTRTHFTRSFQCQKSLRGLLGSSLVPARTCTSTSTMLPLMLSHLCGNLSAALVSCSTVYPYL